MYTYIFYNFKIVKWNIKWERVGWGYHILTKYDKWESSDIP